MRALVRAAAMACVLSGTAQAEVFTSTRLVNASAAALQAEMASYNFDPFTPTLGTVTGVTLTFSGTVNTGAQPIRLFPGEPAPATVSLASTVGFFVAGLQFQQALPVQTRPVIGNTAAPADVSFSVTSDVPVIAGFLADPVARVRAFTFISRTDEFGLNNGGINFDPTSVIGQLTLA